MDLQMPEMVGLTAIRLIRAREAEAGAGRTPILVLSANVMREQKLPRPRAGAEGHLGKPFSAVVRAARGEFESAVVAA
jgi:CheY-like chemotaxis protein